MKTQRRKVSFYIKVGVLVLAVLSFIFSLFMILRDWDVNVGKFPEQQVGDESVTFKGKKYLLKDNMETFLVIGLDKFEGATSHDSYNNDMQADFLFLLVFDNENEQCSAIHINRDTMVPINVLGVAGNKVGTVAGQIALSHTYGNGKEVSCRNTADSVSFLLMGIKVNHYLSMTMDAVSVLNDMVGGVEVEVLDDFTGIDDTLIQGQTVTLMGKQALRYVQTRKGLEDSSNAHRMKRQQQYINNLQVKLQQAIETDDEFAIETATAIADYIVSDRSVNQLQALSDKFSQYEFLGIRDIAGESVVGERYIEFYADYDSLEEMIVEVFYQPK